MFLERARTTLCACMAECRDETALPDCQLLRFFLARFVWCFIVIVIGGCRLHMLGVAEIVKCVLCVCVCVWIKLTLRPAVLF